MTNTTAGTTSRMSTAPSKPQQGQLALAWISRSTPALDAVPTPRLPDDLQRWIARICSSVAEVAAGDRAARQLFTVVSPKALDLLQRRARTNPSRNGPVRAVTSLRVSRLGVDVLEASAVVQGSKRYQAVALQLRRRRGSWVVTAIEMA